MLASIGYYKCPIGTIEIKATDEGLISSTILDADISMFSNDSNAIIEKAIVQFDEYFNKKRKYFDLPLHFIGTNYQIAVWKSVYEIPYGHTRTYSEIASLIGSQKSVRAVGAANGQNPLWIIIPCHRVLGADGSLTGYAGGLWRKKWLLDFESSTKQLDFGF